jgi:hypothetical protein
MERTVFDENGQFLTGSFMDYGLPRASDAVMFQVDSHPVPAKTNPLGAKGCGEAGCAGALPAVMNAVVDALSVYGIRHIDIGDPTKDMPSNPTGAVAELVRQPVASPNGEWWGPVPRCWRYSKQIGRRLCRREQRSAQNQRCRAIVRRWHTRR